jgi:TM2 domain-containing membrane protein YozV
MRRRRRNRIARQEPKNLAIAYLLMFFMGFFGVHKFYLGKIGHGVLYAVLSMTGLGTVPVFFALVYDFFTMPTQVHNSNQLLGYDSSIGSVIFEDHSFEQDLVETDDYEVVYQEPEKPKEPEKSIEHQIIELAEKSDMSQLTLRDLIKAGYDIDESKEVLEKLAQEGVCEEVMVNGAKVYCF